MTAVRPEKVTFIINGKEQDVPYTEGLTLLEAAWDNSVGLPSLCQLGSCGTCIARVTQGQVEMLCNNVLTDKEVAEGYVLVCQGIPVSSSVTIEYD